MPSPSALLSLEEFLQQEMHQVRHGPHPNALSARFVQLHDQARRTSDEDREYEILWRLMETRWRWQQASVEAAQAQHRREGKI